MSGTAADAPPSAGAFWKCITPVSVPLTGFAEIFFSEAVIAKSALACDAARSVVMNGSFTSTSPVASSVTGNQIPVSRSRTAGSQSQPIVERNVGPSIAVSPPFCPTPSATVCSCGMPGCGCGATNTATVARVPGFTISEISKSPRINAPRISPACRPLTQICAE